MDALHVCVTRLPRTAHQVDPGADAHLLAGLHHLQGLVEEHLARQGLVNDLDDAVCQREASPRGVLLHADAAAEGQLDDDASPQRVRDVVVPEGEIALGAGTSASAPPVGGGSSIAAVHCRTCLSFSPSSSTSSISVSLGCLLLSALSVMSRGSKAILWPFSPCSKLVSGALSLTLPVELDRPMPLSSSALAPPPPRRRVSPDEGRHGCAAEDDGVAETRSVTQRRLGGRSCGRSGASLLFPYLVTQSSRARPIGVRRPRCEAC